jgi:Ras-related protein Rab-5C
MAHTKSSKIVVMGDVSVGKTSILTQYIKGTFDQFNESTIGAAFLSKQLQSKSGERVNLEIWDTAGQERYDSLLPMYYRGANVILLIFSLNDPVSFNNLRTRWLKTAENHTLDPLVFIIGNKSDLQQQVADEDIQKLVDEYGNLESFKVSAQNNEGLDEMFQHIVEKIVEYESFKDVTPFTKITGPLVKKKGCC